jgi:hypothetical protein
MNAPYRVGMIVENTKKPEWGPGKILAIEGNLLTIYFRDDREAGNKDGTRPAASPTSWVSIFITTPGPTGQPTPS